MVVREGLRIGRVSTIQVRAEAEELVGYRALEARRRELKERFLVADKLAREAWVRYHAAKRDVNLARQEIMESIT